MITSDYIDQQSSFKGCCKKTFGCGWMGPGPFWIENRILENHEKIYIFDDYWFPNKEIG